MSRTYSTFSLLDQLSHAQAEKRTYVDILFSGFASSTSDGLLSLLRSAGLSPRGRVITNKLELLEALGDRSWDMVFAYNSDRTSLTPAELCRTLQDESRDIPVIELDGSPNCDDQHLAIQRGIAFLLPESAPDLIVARATQLFEQLQQKRRLHALELGVEQLIKLNQRLSDESNLAVATIREHAIVEPNSSFNELFELSTDQAVSIPLNRIFTEASLKQIEQTLKSTTASLHDTLALKDNQGGEFSARVELYPATPDRPRMRPLFIDPMALTSAPTPAELNNQQLLNEAEFSAKLETQLHKASLGGNDAFLLYFEVDAVPSTSDPSQLKQLRKLLSNRLTPLGRQYPIALFNNLNIAVLIDSPDRNTVKNFAQKVEQQLSSNELQLPAGIKTLALGIGISAINDSSPTPRELLLRTEKSVRTLEDQTEANRVFSQQAQPQFTVDSATKELEEAIANHRLKLLFQPLVSLDENNSERSYEILVRMSSGSDHDRLPAEFLSSLEHARVMVKLDYWVVETSLLELKRQTAPGQELKIYINLARRTLKNRSFAPWLSRLLDELEINGERLIFELSESDVAADLEDAVSLCKQLRENHIGICLKHFGCSTSSDKVYTMLMPDHIKLDGAFIEELQYPERGPKAIKRLLEPIDRSRTRVIAPFIEDANMLAELYRIGFDLVQGYYLQPPQEEMRYEYFD